MKAPLSVLVPVKNEAENLGACLASISFADEIVVVDSGSTDATTEIASGFGAQVVQFHWNGKFPRKKNWALENIPWRNEWVLIIDADERITTELQQQIEKAIASAELDGWYLNRRFWFLGGWINHCGYFPSWNLRLFRHQKGRYERIDADAGSGDNEVHEHVLLNGRAGYLHSPMEHYAFPSVAIFIEKHNRYSNWEAAVRDKVLRRGGSEQLRAKLFGSQLERKRWLKSCALRMPFRSTLRFIYHYIFRQGFRDGYRGWVLCRLLAWYEFVSDVKARERCTGRGSDYKSEDRARGRSGEALD